MKLKFIYRVFTVDKNLTCLWILKKNTVRRDRKCTFNVMCVVNTLKEKIKGLKKIKEGKI